jgi:hypothetical protein
MLNDVTEWYYLIGVKGAEEEAFTLVFVLLSLRK